MRNESNEKIIFWPNPFAANTATKCPAEEIERWKFGDNPETETIFDMPGRYSVIASYEGMTVEKGFLLQ